MTRIGMIALVACFSFACVACDQEPEHRLAGTQKDAETLWRQHITSIDYDVEPTDQIVCDVDEVAGKTLMGPENRRLVSGIVELKDADGTCETHRWAHALEGSLKPGSRVVVFEARWRDSPELEAHPNFVAASSSLLRAHISAPVKKFAAY